MCYRTRGTASRTGRPEALDRREMRAISARPGARPPLSTTEQRERALGVSTGPRARSCLHESGIAARRRVKLRRRTEDSVRRAAKAPHSVGPQAADVADAARGEASMGRGIAQGVPSQSTKRAVEPKRLSQDVVVCRWRSRHGRAAYPEPSPERADPGPGPGAQVPGGGHREAVGRDASYETSVAPWSQ